MTYKKVPIKDFPGYKIDTNGIVYSKKGKPLKGSLRGRGKYLSVHLRDETGKSYLPVVHRLVAQTFIPNPENKNTVNHIDANKYNNKLENLEWATNKEQVDHAFKVGLGRMGETHGQHILTEKEVLKIRNSKISQRKLAKIYKVSQTTIWAVKNKKSWRYL